jgi:hypothetical protein
VFFPLDIRLLYSSTLFTALGLLRPDVCSGDMLPEITLPKLPKLPSLPRVSNLTKMLPNVRDVTSAVPNTQLSRVTNLAKLS